MRSDVVAVCMFSVRCGGCLTGMRDSAAYLEWQGSKTFA
ncbi:protein of unknown function [Candidatus Filomicrobium marinum]|uniref:Uncharacterized protein n=1 Tax=Candidatus Filomicrobium marinum TaxID=1608628 RepID=A0A0D6JJC4_9HYPH|nr:protein of unknown function [Candidatus Filomicrobium marinum]